MFSNISLKRFQKSNKIHKKISEHISFPIVLDMTPYMSNTAENAKANAYEQTEDYQKSDANT